MNAHGAALIVITLLAATVNGALGYGFSSITVPLALLFLTNRVLNPALVLIEVPLNAYVLFVNRADVPAVWKRVFPLMIGVEAYNLLNRTNLNLPGFTLGAADFGAISSARPPRTMQLSARFSF